MTPTELVDEQLRGYNARDIDRFCSVFSDDITAYSLKEGKALLKGMTDFRKNYAELFADSPNLNAKIISRIVRNDFVIDEEEVSGRRGQTLKAVAIYKVKGPKITHVWFAL